MLRTLNSQILFFRKTRGSENPFVERLPDYQDEANFRRLRCPMCRWQPSRLSLWICADWGHPEYFFGGCGTPWNTFETQGLCPGCNYQWKYTSCLECGEWSKHEAWYENSGDQH